MDICFKYINRQVVTFYFILIINSKRQCNEQKAVDILCLQVRKPLNTDVHFRIYANPPICSVANPMDHRGQTIEN